MPHPYGLEADQLSLPIDVVARHAAHADRSSRFPEESIAALGAAGLLGLAVSTELGGLAQGPRAFCVAAEELARACGSTAMIYVMHVPSSYPAARLP
jgi:alkylation response protein AidB-like acyl-CoA dehydrogenase